MFDVQQYIADKNLEPYPFKDHKGEIRQLPNLALLTAGQYDALVSKMDTDPVAALSEIAPELIDVLKAIPVLALPRLADEYMEFCKAAVGEALASPAPSKSTARPSKRTSRASTPAKTRKR